MTANNTKPSKAVWDRNLDDLPPLTLGLAGFTNISAIEGVRLSSESRRMFAEFDRRGLTAEQRRKAIAEKHAKKA